MKPLVLPLDTENSSTLKLSPISYDDAGFYVCVADNGIEPSIKSNFTLVIRGMNSLKLPYYILEFFLCFILIS